MSNECPSPWDQVAARFPLKRGFWRLVIGYSFVVGNWHWSLDRVCVTTPMSSLTWYCHRLRAMSAGEVAGHVRKKLLQFADERRQPDWAAVKLESSNSFPKLPPRDQAPEVLREAL